MAKDSKIEEIRQEFLEICPQAVWRIRDLISDPSTPVAVAAQLIGMVLDRALGKAEMPVKVTTTQENVERAEMQILAMIAEIENEMDEDGKLLMPGEDNDGFDDAGDEASGDGGEGSGV